MLFRYVKNSSKTPRRPTTCCAWGCTGSHRRVPPTTQPGHHPRCLRRRRRTGTRPRHPPHRTDNHTDSSNRLIHPAARLDHESRAWRTCPSVPPSDGDARTKHSPVSDTWFPHSGPGSRPWQPPGRQQPRTYDRPRRAAPIRSTLRAIALTTPRSRYEARSLATPGTSHGRAGQVALRVYAGVQASVRIASNRVQASDPVDLNDALLATRTGGTTGR